MLGESLKVVEAARQLKLVVKDDKTVSEADPMSLALAIDALRRSIERFDATTGTSRGRASPLARPDFATPPQMDDDGFEIVDMNLSPDYTPDQDADILEDAQEELEERAEEAREADLSEQPVHVARAGAGPTLVALRSDRNPEIVNDSVDGVFVTDDSIEKLEMGLDLIEDRLGFAVRKSGWSPRLRGLAELAVRAIGQMDLMIDEDRSEPSAVVPASTMTALLSIVTDVATNHSNKIRIEPVTVARLEPPAPRPQPLLDDDDEDEPDNDFSAALL